MIQYGKISSTQAVLTLVACKIFTTITYTPIYVENIEITAVFLGGVVSTLVLLAVIIPLILLFRKTKEDILTLSYRLNSKFGFIVFTILFICTLATSIETLVDFQFFMVNAVFPDISSFVIVVTMFIAALYAASMGLEGLFRTGMIIFIIVVFSLVTIGLTLYNRIDFLNFKPILYEPIKNVLSVAWNDTVKNMELLVFIMIVPNIKGKTIHALIGYAITISVLLCLVSFLVAAVLGEFTFRQIYPFYMISSVVENNVIRRFDAIHMIMWVITAFLRTSLFLLTAEQLLKRVVSYHIGKWSLLISAAIVFGFSAFLSSKLEYKNLIYDFIGSGYPLAISVIVIPIILLINLKKIIPSSNSEKNKQQDDVRKTI